MIYEPVPTILVLGSPHEDVDAGGVGLHVQLEPVHNGIAEYKSKTQIITHGIFCLDFIKYLHIHRYIGFAMELL